MPILPEKWIVEISLNCRNTYNIMIHKQRWVCFALIIFITLILLLFDKNAFPLSDELLNRNVTPISSLFSRANLSEKWVVITTIAYPTAAVKALAAEKGWRVVIVADKKTPNDWNYSNCDFLSIERQRALGYATSRLIPYNSYARKMIGYLYAIQNGAQWIYDTDDDNQPIGLGLKLFDTAQKSSGLSYGFEFQRNQRNLFNPYEFWGQPTIWPRGFPLEDVKNGNVESAFRLCRMSKSPIIQQGLVTKDPDVDALYRLLHADAKSGLNVTFNQHAPPIALNSGIYCPFNSQNTFFHRDAFWALLLPISVTFRVTDIWRGYYAQKLLHLIGHRLGFYPANALQKRNTHSYLADFKDEANLYSDAGRLVDFLNNWTCSFQTLPACIIKLSADFVENDFWKTSDLKLTEAWISDLNSLEYIFPNLLGNNSKLLNNKKKKIDTYESDNCRSSFLHFPVENFHDRKERFRNHREEIKDWCNEALPDEKALTHRFNETIDFTKGIWGQLRKIVLIVTANYPFGPSISIMQRLYEPYFAAVIFCGTIFHENILKTDGYIKINRFSYINMTKEEMLVGYRTHICTSKAIELNLQNFDGYLTIADDLAYNFFNDFDFSRFRLSGIARPTTYWWNSEFGTAAMKNSISIIQRRIRADPNSRLAKVMRTYSIALNGRDVYSFLREPNMIAASDFYYLPRENETFFYELSNVFFETSLFQEIVLPKIGAGLEWFRFYNSSELDIPTYIHLWEDDRIVWENSYSKNITCLHPIKLSDVKDLYQRRKYCYFIIRYYLESISIASRVRLPYQKN